MMKHTLVHLAILTALPMLSVQAAEFTGGHIVSAESPESYSENVHVNGPLELMEGSSMTLNGQVTLRVDGVIQDPSSGNLYGGLKVNGNASLIGKDATISVATDGGAGGLGGYSVFDNEGTVKVKSVTFADVHNKGTLKISETAKFEQFKNEGAFYLDSTDGIIEQTGSGAVFLNFGIFYSSSGKLHIAGAGLQLESNPFFGNASPKKNETENLDSLIIDNLLSIDTNYTDFIEDDDDITNLPRTSLDVTYLEVGAGIQNRGEINAESIKTTGIQNFSRIDDQHSSISASDLLFSTEIKNENGVAEEGKGNGLITIHKSLTYTGSGQGTVDNAGNLYFDGETALVSGNIVVDNQALGVIAKNGENEKKIENLVVDGTLNNQGNLYAKNLAVKNGADGAKEGTSTGSFNVDNLTVLESGDFALNRTETTLKNLAVEKDAKLTGKTVKMTGDTLTNSGTATFASLEGKNLTMNLHQGSVTTENLTADSVGINLYSLDAKLDAKKSSANMKAQVNVKSAANEGSAQDVIKQVTENVQMGDAAGTSKTSYLINAEAGVVNDGFTQMSDDPDSFKSTKNPTLSAFGSVNALSLLGWRHEVNSLSKRMGELRDSAEGIGSWVRLYGSEQEYGAQSVTSKSTTIQVGSDVSVGDWKLGIAANYTDGEATYDNGEADSKSYGVALYGTWFVPCGAYVDLIARYSRLDNDFAVNGMSGSFDNNALSLAAETGYKFSFVDDQFFVEPQVAVNYGRVEGANFKADNGVEIDQDNFTTFTGRAGLRAGMSFPEKKGTVYARVSVVHDFEGEQETTYNYGKSSNFTKDDLGGTWMEYGIGANFSFTDTTYGYVDLERTDGGEVKENYRWNVGLRHVW